MGALLLRRLSVRKVAFLFLIVWFLLVAVNLVREVFVQLPQVQSRHNFYHKCTKDLQFREEYLEACGNLRQVPTTVYMDVFAEAVPRVSVFIFFEFRDLFSYQAMGRMVALALCKMVCGDLITHVLERARGVKQS